jgi:hypothetical protein
MRRLGLFLAFVLFVTELAADQIVYTGQCPATYITLGVVAGAPGESNAVGGNYGNNGTITVNAVLDTATPSLTYQSFVLNITPIVVNIDDNYTVGIGHTVPIHTTITIDSISLSSRNCRLFSLTPGLDGRYKVDHDKLRLDDSFILNGSYSIVGPTQEATKSFSLPYTLPSNTFLFPWFELDTTNYPSTLSTTAWKQNPMTYNDQTINSAYASQFNAVVDGASVGINIQWVSIRLDNNITLTSVPEPSTLIPSLAGAIGLMVCKWCRPRHRKCLKWFSQRGFEMRWRNIALTIAVLVSFAEVALGGVIRFEGTTPASVHKPFGYPIVDLQGSTFPRVKPWASVSHDVTLDSVNRTIFYDKMTFSTEGPVAMSYTISEIQPGTLNTVTTIASVIFDRISITATNVGPLALTDQTIYFDVASNLRGQHGCFPDLPLTGTYSITRGADTVSGPFSLVLPINIGTAFPTEVLYTANYPTGIGLQGYNDVLWRDEVAGGNIIPKTIFSGDVGGFPCLLNMEYFYFTQESYISTLSAVPEPSTIVLLSVGAIGMLVYHWRRRR